MGSIKMLALGLFLLASLNIASGVQLGGECWSSANGIAPGGCDSGTQCGPWNPSGGGWDTVSPWYCVAYPNLKDGATCDYDKKIGLCDTGLSCISGKCADPSAAPTSAPTPCAPTYEGEPKSTCMDTSYPSLYENKCCKLNFTCDLIPKSTRTSFCNGKDLPLGSTCWSDGQSNGTCLSGLLCKTAAGATSGKCSEWTEDSTCQATGVPGHNVCWNSDSKTFVKEGSCCHEYNTGNPDVTCMRDGDNSQGDRFCMMTKIQINQPCGNTAAANYLGLCDRSSDPKLECISGTCVEAPAPTTEAPTPEPAPDCGKGGIKCYDGDTYAETTCCAGVDCPYVDTYTTQYCPTGAGPATCTASSATARPSDVGGVKCWNGAGAAAEPNVDCCFGACPVTASSTADEQKVDGVCPNPA